MVYRVAVGALLSTVDAATDIYVIVTYYKSSKLASQANLLLAMLTVNMVNQLLVAFAQYRKKSWAAKLKEALIVLLFLRPAVDAYRVSKNKDDKDNMTDALTEMMLNKACELAWER